MQASITPQQRKKSKMPIPKVGSILLILGAVVALSTLLLHSTDEQDGLDLEQRIEENLNDLERVNLEEDDTMDLEEALQKLEKLTEEAEDALEDETIDLDKEDLFDRFFNEALRLKDAIESELAIRRQKAKATSALARELKEVDFSDMQEDDLDMYLEEISESLKGDYYHSRENADAVTALKEMEGKIQEERKRRANTQ